MPNKIIGHSEIVSVQIGTNFPTYDNNGNITKYIDESGNVVAAYDAIAAIGK